MIIQSTRKHSYWKSVAGIKLFKVDFLAKRLLHGLFGFSLPKLKDQQSYWAGRGQVYMDEVLDNGVLDREVFFQNLLIEELRRLEFKSCFEAGCGFGWNIRRIKEEFPNVISGGLDFSFSQLANVSVYGEGYDLPVVNGDIYQMPLSDGSFDVGFSVGVFMNIHPDRIDAAIDEMIRVSKKYIIHFEYDQDHTTPELRKIREFKTNIVSHDYKSLYEKRGKNVIRYLTHDDFGDTYRRHIENLSSDVNRWEGYEGPGKYVFALIQL